jgi:CBS domain-containing protein
MEVGMNVETILQTKGDRLATVPADATIEAATAQLKAEGIGALVVSSDGETLEGILSERDIVRGLVGHGAELLAMPVSAIMTKEVTCCVASDSVDDLMAVMSESRIRHLPILDDGKLKGIISIGDVVKARLNELQNEADALREYIAM